jgi:hypothetical protein
MFRDIILTEDEIKATVAKKINAVLNEHIDDNGNVECVHGVFMSLHRDLDKTEGRYRIFKIIFYHDDCIQMISPDSDRAFISISSHIDIETVLDIFIDVMSDIKSFKEIIPRSFESKECKIAFYEKTLLYGLGFINIDILDRVKVFEEAKIIKSSNSEDPENPFPVARLKFKSNATMLVSLSELDIIEKHLIEAGRYDVLLESI